MTHRPVLAPRIALLLLLLLLLGVLYRGLCPVFI
jgi:hypothetical protein